MYGPVQFTTSGDLRSVIAKGNVLYGKLDDHEVSWRDRQQWLRQCGYMLRPRYRTDWMPSWLGTDRFYHRDCEDGQRTVVRFTRRIE